jgi:hypothetical protein
VQALGGGKFKAKRKTLAGPLTEFDIEKAPTGR